MASDEIATDPVRDALASLRASGVALLTSFRRDGRAVATPVSILVAGGKAYVATWSTAGKVKRLAGDPRVTLTPSTRRGRPIGAPVAGIARRLEGAQADRVRAGVLRKNPGAWLWVQSLRLRGRQPVQYEVTPGVAGEPTGASAADRSGERRVTGVATGSPGRPAVSARRPVMGGERLDAVMLILG